MGKQKFPQTLWPLHVVDDHIPEGETKSPHLRALDRLTARGILFEGRGV